MHLTLDAEVCSMLVCLPDIARRNGHARFVRSRSNIVGGGGVSRRITHGLLGVQYPCAMHARIKNQMLDVVSRLRVGRIPCDAIRSVVNPPRPAPSRLKRECPSGTDGLWGGSSLAEVESAISGMPNWPWGLRDANAKEECGECVRMWPSRFGRSDNVVVRLPSNPIPSDDDVRRVGRLSSWFSFATTGSRRIGHRTVDGRASGDCCWCCLVSDSNPSGGHPVGADLVWAGAGFPRRERPTRAAGSLVVKLATLPHGHLHDGNADEV
jgi:hypothetical protein